MLVTWHDSVQNPMLNQWIQRMRVQNVASAVIMSYWLLAPVSVTPHGYCYIVPCSPGSIFIELLSTQICLAWNFFLDKNRITNKFSICCILLVTGIQLMFAHPENHVEIWLVILFLSRLKFHAKQISMLSSSMKLDPVWKSTNECAKVVA